MRALFRNLGDAERLKEVLPSSASHHLSNVASILLIFFRSRTVTFYLIYRLWLDPASSD